MVTRGYRRREAGVASKLAPTAPSPVGASLLAILLNLWRAFSGDGLRVMTANWRARCGR